MKVEISSVVPTSEADAVASGLIDHAIDAGIEARNAQRLFAMARDDQGQLLGGLYANTVWGWLQIKQIWIAAEARHHGIGTQLMTAAENEALQRGCHHAQLDTFDFQARPFYEKLGYAVFGELPDFPRGHRRYFMSKQLIPGN